MHSTTSEVRRQLIALLAASTAFPKEILAQSAQQIRLIVNTSPGAGVDAVARALQAALGQALGTSVFIENQTGASGLIGLQTLSRAPADGHTIGVASANMVIFPSVLKSVPFNVATDFSPIAMIGETPLVLVANPSKVSATNAKDFIAALKSKPEAYNFASSGSGTILHLATEMLLQEVGVKISHIPYKAATPMLLDTISGQVDFSTAALPVALPHIKAGALRAIGLFTTRRAALAPDIPTFAEQGLPSVYLQSWASVFGPKGMAPTLTRKYYEAVVSALKDPTVRDALEKQALVVRIQTPEELQATIRDEIGKYAKLVKQINLQPQ